MLGLDIPVLIPLPRDIISSGKFPLWDALSTHNLCVLVCCGDSPENEIVYTESFPVSIKLYDTLPIYRVYNDPIIETRTSANQQVIVELAMPVSSVGPADSLTLFVRTMTNAQNYKVKRNLRLNKLTLQIKEILECHEGGLPIHKELKLITTNKVYTVDEQLLTTQGISHQFQLDFPIENDYLQLYSGNSNKSLTIQSRDDHESLAIQLTNISRNIELDKLDEGIPNTHTQGFTTFGKLFSIRYEVVVKINMSHAKDIEVRLPLTVLPYDRVSSDHILQWIHKECEAANYKFGKNMVHQLASCLNYEETKALIHNYNPPPVLYRNIKSDWVRLGYSSESFGSKLGRNLVQLID